MVLNIFGNFHRDIFYSQRSKRKKENESWANFAKTWILKYARKENLDRIDAVEIWLEHEKQKLAWKFAGFGKKKKKM